MLRSELVPGATVMVGKGAPTDGDEADVALSVVAPAKVPAAVGAPAEGETEEHRDVEPPPAAEGEGSEQS